tara:strand:+ start:8779 stop:9129 length:351 start_codon:yes stop_codon:yes gene_type:complete
MIRLADTTDVYCPECLGSGKVRQAPTYSTRTKLDGRPVLEPSTGAVVPCPRCRGRRTVTVSSKPERTTAPRGGVVATITVEDNCSSNVERMRARLASMKNPRISRRDLLPSERSER